MKIGVISDTHGALPQQAIAALAGVERIIHAGDIGTMRIIRELQQIAPVDAITGNVDWDGPLDTQFPLKLELNLGGCSIYAIHIGGKPREFIRHLPVPYPQVAICGHSHIPLIERHEGVLFVNPGSAGQPRFGNGTSIAILTITDGQPEAELLRLE